MERKAFYDALRSTLVGVESKPGTFTEANVVGFELMLNEAERRRTPLGEFSYYLATAWWESGKTMAPVREAFYLGTKAEAVRKKMRYYPYYGRGLIQLTWKENYKKASDFLGVDLVGDPDKALDPGLSVKILFEGLSKGWFTGKKVSDYVDNIDESDQEDLREFSNARRAVNLLDKAVEIGKLGIVFEKALKGGKYGEVVSPVDLDSRLMEIEKRLKNLELAIPRREG